MIERDTDTLGLMDFETGDGVLDGVTDRDTGDREIERLRLIERVIEGDTGDGVAEGETP
jgi:hypothetical protein